MWELILTYWGHLQKALIFLVIVLVFYLLSSQISKRILKARFIGDINYQRSLSRFIRLFFLSLGFILGLASIGVSLSGLLAAAGFTGIVVGLAAQQTLGNLIAGLALLFEGRVKIGDTVRVGDSWGRVESVGLLSSNIRLFSGELLSLPNQQFMNSQIVNVSNIRARRIDVSIGISYSSDIESAKRIILSYLNRHPYVLAVPQPMVYVDSLGDSSVNLRIFLWTPAEMWLSVRAEVIGYLKVELEKNGIEIPFPQRVVWLRQKSS